MINKQLKNQVKRTIKFMERNGWCTGTYRKTRTIKGKKVTGYCVLGAFGQANGIDPTTSVEDLPLLKAFSDKFGMSLVQYNDEVATKKERVIAKLRRLIED